MGDIDYDLPPHTNRHNARRDILRNAFRSSDLSNLSRTNSIQEERVTPENFCYWLQGFFELQTPKRPEKISLNDDQVKMIEDHLKSVFAPATVSTHPGLTFTYPGPGDPVIGPTAQIC